MGDGPLFRHRIDRLCVQPGWNSESLAESERVVAGAPSFPGIIFKEAKLPKDWTGNFVLKTDDGPVDVDCQKIGFELAHLSNGDIELAVRLESRLAPWKWDVVSVWIDSEIGERNKIVRVTDCRIEAYEQMPDAAFRLRDIFFALFTDACYCEEVTRMEFDRWAKGGEGP